MADWKNYTMIVLSAVMLASLGLNAMPEPSHYCDSRQIKAYCFSVSSTEKTCYTLPAKHGGKLCDEKWKAIPPPEVSIPAVEQGLMACAKVNVIGYVNDCQTGEVQKYFCDGVGEQATCYRNQDLLMPFG